MKPQPAPRSRAAIALGGNQGDVERTFKGALNRLQRDRRLTLLRRSDWFPTEPVGGPAGQPSFLNGAITVEMQGTAQDLLAICREVEEHFGRQRDAEVHHGPRPLDLDLLLFGDQVIDSPELNVPHPRLRERRFVLEPLAQIAGDWIIPASHGHAAQSVGACWQTFADSLPEGAPR